MQQIVHLETPNFQPRRLVLRLGLLQLVPKFLPQPPLSIIINRCRRKPVGCSKTPFNSGRCLLVYYAITFWNLFYAEIKQCYFYRNACPVKEEVVAPFWANNTRGEVLALLNMYPFEQYVHWEKCTFENKQMYCRDGCRCEQQYRLHRYVSKRFRLI